MSVTVVAFYAWARLSMAAPGVYPPIDGIEQVKVQAIRDLSDTEIQKWGSDFKRIFKG